jgi:DivIVA domain-containing protein
MKPLRRSRMPFSPDEIQAKSFSVVYGRGYDRSEVTQFLEELASDYGAALEARARARDGASPTEESIGEEIQDVLRAARESAARIREKAEQDAKEMVAEVEHKARALVEKAERAEAQMRERTKKETQATMADAKQRARETKEKAEKEARDLLADAHKRFHTMAAHEQLLRERIDLIEDLVQKLKEEIEPLATVDLAAAETGEEPSRAR